ncbi:conserved hypothetical protein [Methanocella paludicola SANAE]|uniref:DUF4350 domain-containing protein n=1 Tax=Methanocella paludicola (strain DSM 17711 / JCM 13418 / NBRC 101707 / SANAE) TaxID=304371 RepID=D1YWX4_METPS|nr:DUF4350 domain-containing protein [Methanocella paludicola]BAI60946.1 conserved hypothetical protein [Methanocella paludicola SANAE]
MRKTTLLIVIVVSIVLVVVAARLYVTDADFRLTNPYWNGLNNMARHAGIQPLYDLSGLDNAGSGDILMVISPAVNYTAGESSQVAAFLGRGGTVVVLDDFGKANSLLTGIGSPFTIDPVPMCQYENYYVNQSFPTITDIAATPYTANVSKLVLNHPAVLNISGNAVVLASTSPDAWLDYNDDIWLDYNDRMGIYPVAARYSAGNGELIVVSDADIFINSMLDKGDNRAFLQDLSRGRVLVDVSHGNAVTPLGSVYFTLKGDIIAQLTVLLLIIVACIAYIGRDMFIPRLGMIRRSIKNLILNRLTVKEKDIKKSD